MESNTTAEPQIDTDLYSRQIGTFGMETMGKLIKMKVVIVGLRGLGIEVAKNLILAGPKQVSLYDPDLVRLNDLGSNFYCEEKHVGKVTRANACLGKLSELNPHVKVDVIQSAKDLNAGIAGGEFNLVCQTELHLGGGYQDPQALNEMCRAKNVAYISSATLGPWGYAFVDFGDNHTVTDHDGEQTKSFIITMIEKGKQTTVQVHEDKRHIFQEGDHVKLIEVEGMTEINGTDPHKIISTKSHSFVLELDSSGFSDYARQGVVENVKVAKPFPFHSWEKSYKHPVGSSQYGMLETPDLAKFGRSDQLHFALMGIIEFLKANNRYPCAGDVDTCLQLATASVAANKASAGEGDSFFIEVDDDVKKVFSKAVSYAGCSISPMCAFYGGIVAQEIVKLTGKYTPMKQWLHFDIYETLPREDGVDRSPQGSRYDDQIQIYGKGVQEKLLNTKLFMVGAGALGCELIKAFALMGIGCGASGIVHCTDNDNIEVSNLNRQFLFRQQHVGKSKSETACATAKGMNGNLNVKDYMTRVGPETEETFNDTLWESLDFVVNAVDNIHARLYVDGKCVWYEKPLLESGTLGTKANSQMIVPHKTQCYGDSQDPPEEAIPMCTLRNFPNQIEHCIEWGRDKFNGLFVDVPSNLVTYLDNPKVYLFKMKNDSTTPAQIQNLTQLVDMINLRLANDYKTCIKLAMEQYNEYYDHSIMDLLSIFPSDALDKDNNPFWGGPKRCPSPIPMDLDNKLCNDFVFSYANLIALALGIEQNRNQSDVTAIARTVQCAAYVPKKIKVVTPEEEKEQAAGGGQAEPEVEAGEDDDEVIKKLEQQLVDLQTKTMPQKNITKESFQPAEFEKDDDKNFHIDFINASSNLRATNYVITNCDRQKTKMIAGKIIPAIATTTAMITGAVTAEIFKFVQGYTALEDVKNSFINLALPLFVFSEPTEVGKKKDKDYDPIARGPIKCVPENFTVYSKVVVNEGPMTFQSLFDFLGEKYKIDIQLVSVGQVGLYNAFLAGEAGKRQKARLAKDVKEVYNDVAGKEFPIPGGRTYLIMSLVGGFNDGNEADLEMPPLQYYFEKKA